MRQWLISVFKNGKCTSKTVFAPPDIPRRSIAGKLCKNPLFTVKFSFQTRARASCIIIIFFSKRLVLSIEFRFVILCRFSVK